MLWTILSKEMTTTKEGEKNKQKKNIPSKQIKKLYQEKSKGKKKNKPTKIQWYFSSYCSI